MEFRSSRGGRANTFSGTPLVWTLSQPATSPTPSKSPVVPPVQRKGGKYGNIFTYRGLTILSPLGWRRMERSAARHSLCSRISRRN
ncbi:hypothetical protein ACOME3_003814 [Neoechinorhynchus agilis]